MKANRLIDSLALYGVNAVLLVAFYFQLAHGELPCSLCNLQRVAFMLLGAGLMLNVWNRDPSPANYALSAVGALVGSLIGLMQMFLHVLPGTPPYGGAILGMHMYTASYLVLTASIIYCVLMLAFRTRLQAIQVGTARHGEEERSPFVGLAAWLFAALVIGNLVSVFVETGFHALYSDPQHYHLLYCGDPETLAAPGSTGCSQ
ncbi:disulfide bond formation protein B [Burkholderia cepacia]|uniref:disulfide bond formation protein B n=1 Tax=Burkholderia cepacia TaxID=292 RepID=UPI000F59441B|nr:disulfide bond formation protein B [Burkholderia cepacia]RQT83923.1 disulfide bond formation protein B [Burkholderia cepacia]